MSGCTRGGEKRSGQFAVCGDVFDLLDHVHQPPNDRGDSSVAQNPAARQRQREGESEKDVVMSYEDKDMMRRMRKYRKRKEGKEDSIQSYITCSYSHYSMWLFHHLQHLIHCGCVVLQFCG